MAEDQLANWIQAATSKHKGAFGAQAKRAGESTAQFASQHAGDSGVTGKRARLAQTLMKLNPSRKFGGKPLA